MHAPAVFDTRDPFSTCAGSRVSLHNATTRIAMAPNGCFFLLARRTGGTRLTVLSVQRRRRATTRCTSRGARWRTTRRLRERDSDVRDTRE